MAEPLLRPRHQMAVGIALAVLLVVAVAYVAADDGDDERLATAAGITTTTTLPAPAVLGDVVERPPATTTTTIADTETSTSTGTGTGTGTDDVGSGAPESTPTTEADTATAAPAPTAPPTTVCRNSAEPSCGPLVWDPAPQNQEPGVVVVESVEEAVVGRPVRLVVAVEDPDGGAGGGICEDWDSSDPGVIATGSCSDVPEQCSRFGPHDPPAPSPARTTHGTTVTFTEVGVQTVTVSGFTPDTLPDGCPNPYHSTWSHTFQIRVVDDPEADQVEQQS